LEEKSFTINSVTTGYLVPSSFNLTISPLTLSTITQSSLETITASIALESTLDDAMTTLTVVNPGVKTAVGTKIKIEIPDYFSEALSKIGLAKKVVLNFNNSLSKNLDCCEYSKIKEGRELELSITIAATAGPFTIIGVPMPQGLKEYVTLDALAVTLTGIGKGLSIKGNYEGCQNSTQWSGSGGFSANLGVGGEVKAKFPGEIIVIQGSIKGSTGVSETIAVDSPQVVLSGKWDGLSAEGQVTLKAFKLINIVKKISEPILAEKIFPRMSISLPTLEF
jgi:PPE-repeat protein